MAKISTYPEGEELSGQDKLIGTDGNKNNSTKNFTISALAEFFNLNGAIHSQEMPYKYQDWQHGEARESGTISFDTPQLSDDVLFSSVSGFKISTHTKSQADVRDFYGNPLTGNYILITRAGNASDWAIFTWDSAVVDAVESGFYDVSLTLHSSSGYLRKDYNYFISLLQVKSIGSGVSSVSTEGGLSGGPITSTGTLSLKNFSSFSDSSIVKWDDANSQFVDSIITESGGSITISGNAEAQSFSVSGGESGSFLKADGSLDNTDYQDRLISGTNIKTVNGSTLLGSGDLVINIPVLSVNGYTGVIELGKGDIGLSQVDNTSDADKPISIATQSGLDGKLESGNNVSELVNDAGYLTTETDQTLILTTVDATSRDLTTGDRNMNLENSADITYTLRLNSVQAFPVGAVINFVKKVESMDWVAEAGVTITSVGSSLEADQIGGGTILHQTAIDEWNLIGNLI